MPSPHALFDNFEKAKRSPTPQGRPPGAGDPNSDDEVDEQDPLHVDDYDLGENDHKFTRKRPRKGIYKSSPDHSSRLPLRIWQAVQLWRPPPIIAHFVQSRRRCMIIAGAIFIVFFLLTGSTGWFVLTHSTIDGQSPPWYPSPHGGTAKEWEWSYQKAAFVVSKMTLAEKVNVTTGTGWMMGPCVGNTGPANNVGMPSLCLQDGPLGLRWTDNVTVLPAGITVGSTWNPSLMHKRGRLMGVEARHKGVNVLLGPSVGPLGRLPAGGRNWEGFGSDPFLQSVGAMMTVRGIQDEGVMATIKHFVGNEQEHFRQSMEWGLPNAISSNIDDRTLHELYVAPFAAAIRVGVSAVMCSYNQVNNSYACQNSKLLNGILKDELGFQGFVVSDWLAQRSGVASALAGLDMSMPGDGKHWADGKSYWGPELSRAVLNGSVPMDRMNDMVTRIIAAWFKAGQDRPQWFNGPNFSSWTDDEYGLTYPGSSDKSKSLVNSHLDAQSEGGFSHGSMARRIAAEGVILLKNDNEFLPLSRNGYSQKKDIIYEGSKKIFRIAIFGEDAFEAPGGPNACADRGCNKGTLASGWGSGTAEFPYLVTPIQALEANFDKDRVEISSYPSNDVPHWNGKIDLPHQDLCIVFVNAASGEGFIAADGIRGDRNDLNIQKNGDKLIKAVAAHCGSRNLNEDDGSGATGNTIVVMHTVGPVIVEEWIEDPNIRAVINANLPGQESGNALADVLFGHVNPSGHLPYTMGKSLEDYGPTAEVMYYPDSVQPQQNFTEGLLIDYRHFDYYNIEPRYPFGHGLSYTTFKISGLVIATMVDVPEPLPPRRPDRQAQPPVYSQGIPDPHEVFWPSGLKKIKKFVYPYLTSAENIQKGRYPYPTAYPQRLSDAGGGEGGHPALWDEIAKVTVTVQNEGWRDGQAVLQLYVRFPEEVWEDVEEMPVGPLNAGEDTSGNSPARTKLDSIKNSTLDDQVGIDNSQLANPGDPPPAENPAAAENDPGNIPPNPRSVKARDTILDKRQDQNDHPDDAPPPPPPPLPKQPVILEGPGAHNELIPSDDHPLVPEPAKPEVDESDDLDTIKGPENHPNQVPTDHDFPMPGFHRPNPMAGKTAHRERIYFPIRQLRGFVKTHVRGSGDPRSGMTGIDREEQARLHRAGMGMSGTDVVWGHGVIDHDHPRVPVEKEQWKPESGADPLALSKETVTFVLTRRDLSYWSVRRQNWVIPKGAFTVEVGLSSRDIHVSGKMFG